MKSFSENREQPAAQLPFLRNVPKGWGTVKLKHALTLSRERNGREPVGEMLAVSGYQGVIPKQYDHEARKRSPEELEDYRVVRKGQLVVNTMWLNHAGLGVSAYEGYVSPAYRCYWVGSRFDRRYLHYLLRSEIYVARYCSLLYGIRPNSFQVKTSDFDSLTLLRPPRATQRTIATFLDRETAKIDALIDRKQRLIELLQEKRTALITQAVTQGLDPDVEMKDSGVEWFGKIPNHWDLVQLRYLVRPETTITYGIVQAGPHIPEGIPYIRTGDMSGDSLPTGGYKRTSKEIDQAYRRSKVSEGDVVVAIRATVGKALLVPEFLEGANLTQGTARVAPSRRLASEFLLYALKSNRSQQRLSALSKGATFREITLDMLRRFEIPLPPPDEQRRIIESLRVKLEEIEAVARLSQGAIDRLREYRTALISAAVTGKIDVREAA